MSFIKKRLVNNTVYVYEITSYREKTTGQVKKKWKILGKLDADGNVIPSKKRASAEAVSLESSLNSQNYSQNSPNVNNNVNDIENNNDTIVTASMNDTAAANIATTAATATTTLADVADNVSDTTHNNMPKPDMMSDTKIDAVYDETDWTDGTISSTPSTPEILSSLLNTCKFI